MSDFDDLCRRFDDATRDALLGGLRTPQEQSAYLKGFLAGLSRVNEGYGRLMDDLFESAELAGEIVGDRR